MYLAALESHSVTSSEGDGVPLSMFSNDTWLERITLGVVIFTIWASN
jgi:hypothetical protein